MIASLIIRKCISMQSNSKEACGDSKRNEDLRGSLRIRKILQDYEGLRWLHLRVVQASCHQISSSLKSFKSSLIPLQISTRAVTQSISTQSTQCSGRMILYLSPICLPFVSHLSPSCLPVSSRCSPHDFRLVSHLSHTCLPVSSGCSECLAA